MLTEEELQAIETREKAATPGPWVRVNPCDGPGKCRGCDEYGHGAQDYIKEADSEEGFAEEIITCDSGVYGPGYHDAEFIVHARTDVPALVAEVRRLQGLISEGGPDA